MIFELFLRCYRFFVILSSWHVYDECIYRQHIISKKSVIAARRAGHLLSQLSLFFPNTQMAIKSIKNLNVWLFYDTCS